MRPTEITRSFGMSWGVGGWLVFPFLAKLDPHRVAALKQRVADELKTTFASHYDREVSLAEALSLDTIAIYNQRATGTKFLIRPNRAP
jgi:NADPH2:quinone reductase